MSVAKQVLPQVGRAALPTLRLRGMRDTTAVSAHGGGDL